MASCEICSETYRHEDYVTYCDTCELRVCFHCYVQRCELCPCEHSDGEVDRDEGLVMKDGEHHTCPACSCTSHICFAVTVCNFCLKQGEHYLDALTKYCFDAVMEAAQVKTPEQLARKLGVSFQDCQTRALNFFPVFKEDGPNICTDCKLDIPYDVLQCLSGRCEHCELEFHISEGAHLPKDLVQLVADYDRDRLGGQEPPRKRRKICK